MFVKDIPPAPFYFLQENVGEIDYVPYIKITQNYIIDFIDVLEADNRGGYNSKMQNQTIEIEELKTLLFKLTDLTYGK